MKKQFTVFSSHLKSALATAKLADGSEVQATIPALEVQLVPVNPLDGTINLTITGNTATSAAEELFAADAVINVTFSAEE